MTRVVPNYRCGAAPEWASDSGLVRTMVFCRTGFPFQPTSGEVGTFDGAQHSVQAARGQH